MFDPAENTRSDEALREGLYDLPTPEVSADFDARIQSALLRRPSWWQAALISWRPALPAAAWTLAGMLLLLHVIQTAPAGTRMAPAFADARSTRQSRRHSLPANGREKASEEGMENMDLTYASLSFFSRPLHRSTDKSG